MAMNEAERDAIVRKLNHPEEEVKCPRCGETLICYEVGNSLVVYCKKCEDVQGTARGI